MAAERNTRLIPYDPNILPPDQAEVQVDGNGDWRHMTNSSGYLAAEHMMVEVDGVVRFDKVIAVPADGVFVTVVRKNPAGQVEFKFLDEARIPLGRRIPNIPQGRKDEGETYAEAAKREVFEETGYENMSLAYLGDQFIDASNSSASFPFFLAYVPYDEAEKDLKQDGTEDIRKMPWMTYQELKKMGIEDGKSNIGLALAERVIWDYYLTDSPLLKGAYKMGRELDHHDRDVNEKMNSFGISDPTS
ncbi:MAG TPA: NUDIX hydrolase [Patescibacteria group bacterium]|nr:NUDIX hydrolase [Patescibacteria group bacterium]